VRGDRSSVFRTIMTGGNREGGEWGLAERGGFEPPVEF
jgi:hypothetical protein